MQQHSDMGEDGCVCVGVCVLGGGGREKLYYSNYLP